jgi:hypothetical protein
MLTCERVPKDRLASRMYTSLLSASRGTSLLEFSNNIQEDCQSCPPLGGKRSLPGSLRFLEIEREPDLKTGRPRL